MKSTFKLKGRPKPLYLPDIRYRRIPIVMRAVPALLPLCVLAAIGCGGDDSGGDDDGTPQADARPPDTFDRQAMVANLAEQILLPTYEAFAARAAELGPAVDAHCAALGGKGEAAARTAAQDAWRAAMLEWQAAEVMLLGPAAMDDSALRDVIYSWPVTSTCAVDRAVMERHPDPDAYELSGQLSNRRGLPALEHVLFSTSLEHTCPAASPPEGWEALAEAERARARCGFAQAAAADLAAQADAVAAGWRADGGNYVGQLASAGESGSDVDTPQEAANLISDAMFYIDTETKDMKLGEPAGIADNSCGAVEEPCAAELESRLSAHSKENVVRNLEAFRMLYTGDRPPAGGGLGFDDFLAGLGAGDVAEQMGADIDAAIAAAGGIPGTLEEALAADRESVVTAYGSVKTVTDTLKSQFLTVLGLDIPDGAAGDND
jgi:predicted lipoprotein